MQIFKLFPTACAVVICASFISVRADDTPVQAALRAALEQKMSDLDKQQTQAPPVVATSPGAVKVQPSQHTTNTVPAKATTPAANVAIPTPKPVMPAPQAAPAVAAPAVTAPATPAPAVVTPAVAAPVVAEPQSAPAETAPATPAPVANEPATPAEATPATTPAEAAPATPPPAETKPAPTMTPGEPAAAATIASETNAAPAASGTTPAAPVATMPTEVTPATPPPTETRPAPPAITPAAGTVLQSPAMPAMIKVKPGVMSATNQINAIYTGKELGLKPIESPLLPVSAAQQAQLQALLAKYKANQITPEEYYKQRAEILAQP
jgi:hypothetical protein